MNVHELYRPFLRFFRTRRMREFQERFGLEAGTTVLDVGGSLFNWQLLSDPPNPVLLNLSFENSQANSMNRVIADGRHLPFRDHSFEVAYSNSVIEHLAIWENQRLFAEECQRVAPSYYVQTPNRGFLIEPHLITPFIHWLPRNLRRRLLRNFTIWGIITRPTQEYCDAFVDEVRLISVKELRELFRGADIEIERFLFLLKSLIALKVQADS